MSHIKRLEKLLKEDVILEVNENIKEIENKKPNKETKEALEYMKKVKLYFDEALEDIKLGNMSEEEALDILEGLEDMRVENQEV